MKHLLSVAVLVLSVPLPALALQVRYPARLGEHEFIYDEAKIIKPEDAAEIKQVGEALLSEKSIPMAVVTLKSLNDYGAGAWRLESYAHHLFAHWGLGRRDWNYGILLLVSTGDRKARIEMGASWGHVKDAATQTLMNEEIIPRFKQGDYSAGLREGVKGLKGVTSDLVVPQTGAPPMHAVTPPESPQAPRPPPITYTPPQPVYVRPHQTTGFSDSGWHLGGCFMIILVFAAGVFIIGLLMRAFSGGSSSWGPGGYGGGYGPGYSGPGYYGGGGGGFGSSFGGGFLGSMLGNWFSSGSSYGGYRRSWWDDGPPYGGGGWFGGGGGGYYSSGSSSSSSDFGGGSSSSWGGDSGGSSSSSGDSGGGFSDSGGASGSW
jgi:uncharacterized protein